MDSEDNVIRIVLLGTTGVGKSSTGNALVGDDVFPVASKISMVSLTGSCSIRAGKYTQINVIDTPGFLNNEHSKEYISDEIRHVFSLASPGPHVFLIVINCTEKFTPAKAESTQTLKTIFGETMMDRTVLILTGNNIDDDIAQTCMNTFINQVGKPRGWIVLNEEHGKDKKEELAKMLFRKFEEYSLTKPKEYYRDPCGQFEKAYNGDDEGAVKSYEMCEYDRIARDNKEYLDISKENIVGFRQLVAAEENSPLKRVINRCNNISLWHLIGNFTCIVGNVLSMPRLMYIGAAASVFLPGILNVLFLRKESFKKDGKVFSKFDGEMSTLKEELFKLTKQQGVSMCNQSRRGTTFIPTWYRMIGSAMPAALYSVVGLNKTVVYPSLNEPSKKMVLQVACLAVNVFFALLAFTDLMNGIIRSKREGNALRMMVKELKTEQKMLHENPAFFVQCLHQKRTLCDIVRRIAYRNERSSQNRNTFQNIMAELVPDWYQDPIVNLLHIFTPHEIKTKTV